MQVALQIEALIIVVLHFTQLLLQLHRLLALFHYQHLFFKVLRLLEQVPVSVVELLYEFRVVLQLLLHLPHFLLAVPLHECHPSEAFGSQVGLDARTNVLCWVVVKEDYGGSFFRRINLIPFASLFDFTLCKLILHSEELEIVFLNYLRHVLSLQLWVYVF